MSSLEEDYIKPTGDEMEWFEVVISLSLR